MINIWYHVLMVIRYVYHYTLDVNMEISCNTSLVIMHVCKDANMLINIKTPWKVVLIMNEIFLT